MNLGDASFLDGVGPGLLAEEIGDGSQDGKVANDKEGSVAGAPSINAVSGLTHIALLTKDRLLGGWV